MSGRDPQEDHRASTPLELFFDLCFVVAVAAAAATLHHDLAEGHLSGLTGYATVFFAIWWAWVSQRPMDDSLRRETSFVFGYGHGFVFLSVAAVAACLATLVDVVEHDAHVGSRTAVLLLVGSATVYLLVIAGIHSLADGSLATAVPALVVVAALWVVGLLGLGPGTSVLLVGVAVALSLADHVRRTNRADSAGGGLRA